MHKLAAFNQWNDSERNVNVNRNDNDWNDNWWFAGVRNFLYFPSFYGGFYFKLFNQPPSIFPISFNFSERFMYFLLSKDFISQAILIKILRERVNDKNIMNLLKEIIFSFKPNGLPLGNLTSQLFANVYLNELDQFVKHKLKIQYYARYADDFVILSEDRNYLENLIPIIKDFLQNRLKLNLHPDKIFIKTLYSGVDFLGWVNFLDHKVLRTKTENRMFKRIKKNSSVETLNSYLGLLKHGNSHKIEENLLKMVL